jgi:thiosulfate reductase cytochrome b subunit
LQLLLFDVLFMSSTTCGFLVVVATSISDHHLNRLFLSFSTCWLLSNSVGCGEDEMRLV